VRPCIAAHSDTEASAGTALVVGHSRTSGASQDPPSGDGESVTVPCALALRAIPDRYRALSETHRVLRLGGVARSGPSPRGQGVVRKP
jgi:hypothetical protein